MMSDFRVGRGVQNSVIYGRSQIDFVVLRKTRPLSVQEKTNQILALMEKDRNSCISCRLMASLHTFFLHIFFYYRTFQLPVQRLLCVHQWIQWTTLWKTCFQHTVTSYYILCSSIQKFATVLCKEPYDRAALTQGKNSGTFCNPLGCLFDFLPEQFSFHLMESFVSLVYL